MTNTKDIMTETENTKKSSKKWIIVPIILLLLLGAFHIYNRGKQEELGAGVSGYILKEGAEPGLTEEELRERLQMEVDKSVISFNLQSIATSENKDLNITFSNPRYNAHDLALEIELDGETIVRTEKISPNQYLDEVKLTKRLPEGTHTAVGKVVGYDSETGEFMGQVHVEIEINV